MTDQSPKEFTVCKVTPRRWQVFQRSRGYGDDPWEPIGRRYGLPADALNRRREYESVYDEYTPYLAPADGEWVPARFVAKHKFEGYDLRVRMESAAGGRWIWEIAAYGIDIVASGVANGYEAAQRASVAAVRGKSQHSNASCACWACSAQKRRSETAAAEHLRRGYKDMFAVARMIP